MEHTGFHKTSAVGVGQNKFVFHKIIAVRPLDGYKLEISFENGFNKIYDVDSLFDKRSDFYALRDEIGLFELVQVEPGGYAVSWNDAIDISSEELWNNGR